MNWKILLVPALVVCASLSVHAEQKPAPELKGVVSAGAKGVNADRLVFENFKTSPDAIFNVVRITVQPGSSIPMHSHSGPEFHIVTAGELEETIDNEAPKTLKAGEWVYLAPGRAHGLVNKGKEPATFVAFISGKQGEPLTTPLKKK